MPVSCPALPQALTLYVYIPGLTRIDYFLASEVDGKSEIEKDSCLLDAGRWVAAAAEGAGG